MIFFLFNQLKNIVELIKSYFSTLLEEKKGTKIEREIINAKD